MSASLTNFTAPDEYSEEVGYLRCQETAVVRINVSNQAIFWRRGFGPPGGTVNWEPEEELPPIRASLAESCDSLQVRAAIPAAQLPAGFPAAQVNVATRTAREMRA